MFWGQETKAIKPDPPTFDTSLPPETRLTVFAGAVFAFCAVAFGAFGSHALKAALDANGTAQTFQTGAHYHLTHALALLLVAVLPLPARFQRRLRLLFSIGILIFSGSLYLLAITNVRWLGAITPLGGLCFLSGWLTLAYASLRAPASVS